MTKYEKKTHISKIVLAPIVYYVISMMVSMVFTSMCEVIVKIKNPRLSKAELLELTEQFCNSQIMLITLIAALVSIPVIYYMFFDSRGEGIKESLAYVFVGLFGFGCCISFNFLVSVLNLPAMSKTYQEVAKLIYTGNILLEILAVGIAAPIIEELIYRGVVFKRINAMIKTIPAVLLSSVIFGAIHGNLVQFVYATCLGVALCFVYIKCKSIAAPILLHMTANMVSVLISDVKPVSDAVNKPVVFFYILLLAIIMTFVCPLLISKYSKKSGITDVSAEQIYQSSDTQQ